VVKGPSRRENSVETFTEIYMARTFWTTQSAKNLEDEGGEVC
jgi:hypothetical protein